MADDIVEVSTNYTVEPSVRTVVVNATGPDVDVTLPDITPRRGIDICVVRKDSTAATVRILPYSGQTCGGGSSITVPAGEAVEVIAPPTGLDWRASSKWSAGGGSGQSSESHIVLAAPAAEVAFP